jgi:hypothetical protein
LRCRPITVSGLTMPVPNASRPKPGKESPTRSGRPRSSADVSWRRAAGYKSGVGVPGFPVPRQREIERGMPRQRAKADERALRGGEQLSSSQTDRSLRLGTSFVEGCGGSPARRFARYLDLLAEGTGAGCDGRSRRFTAIS